MYWHIPLRRTSWDKTAFSMPWGLFHFRARPFDLHEVAATFQHLKDKIREPHNDYAAAYVGNMVIFSQDWETYIQQAMAVLHALKASSLIANPVKWAVGERETQNLGYLLGVGRGMIKPLVDKEQDLRDCPIPETKNQV